MRRDRLSGVGPWGLSIKAPRPEQSVAPAIEGRCRAFIDARAANETVLHMLRNFFTNDIDARKLFVRSFGGRAGLAASRAVRVNAVAQAYIDASLNRLGAENPEMSKHWISGAPMGRMERVDEVGSIALFLASGAARLLTGSIVLADGGYSCQ
jgi:hypothetical protein